MNNDYNFALTVISSYVHYMKETKPLYLEFISYTHDECANTHVTILTNMAYKWNITFPKRIKKAIIIKAVQDINREMQ